MTLSLSALSAGQFSTTNMYARCRTFLFASLVAMVSACGGGGGGGDASGTGSGTGSGGNNPPATLMVSPSSISVNTDVTQAAPTADLQVSVQSTSAAQFYIGGSVTHSAVTSIALTSQGTFGTLTVQFKSPAALGPGTYHDTLTLEGCYDQACTQQISSSPASIPITLVVGQPASQLYGLTPSSVVAGAPGFVLSVSGADFQNDSQVLWNGSARPTTYVSSSQVTAQIAPEDVAASGTVNVQVSTGGALSTTLPFTITPLPAFSFDQVSPRTITAGAGPFYISAIGNGFTSSTAISWNGTTLTTTYVSGKLIRALITPDQVAAPGSASVAVVRVGDVGGSSNPISVTIVAPTLDAVAYQMNPAHTGSISFQNMSLPADSTWSVDVGGSPSYALIVGGRVFVTVTANGNSQLLALDAGTGATLWGPIAFSGTDNAAYDGGHLYVVSGSALSQVITALDPATGNAQWSATVPGGWFPEPPVAADGIVYTVNGGYVTAFNGDTGATLWNNGIGGTSGIVSVTPDGVYGSSPCTATNLQPLVGTILWSYNSGCEGGGGATPVVANGVMYSPDASASSSGTVLDAESGTVKGTYTASVIPALTSSTAFILNNVSTLQGLARSNNQILWSFAGDGQLSSAPVVVNNYVFIGSAGGNVYALDGTTGAQVWTKNLGGAIPSSGEYGTVQFTGLAAGNGLLVVPNGTKVTAYTLSSSP